MPSSRERPSARRIRAQAQQPARPDDPSVVRLQRLDNRLSRANARTSFYGTAAFTAVFAVLAIVVTVVRAWHAGTPLVWVACVVWVALGCFLVRPGRGEVGAAEHRRVRRRPDRDLGLLRLTS